MVYAYHTIFAAYGIWLPNDPGGSWSDFVRSCEADTRCAIRYVAENPENEGRPQ